MSCMAALRWSRVLGVLLAMAAAAFAASSCGSQSAPGCAAPTDCVYGQACVDGKCIYPGGDGGVCIFDTSRFGNGCVFGQ